jgi:hypothetical protein
MTRRLTIRLNDEVVAGLRALAEQKGISMTDALREAIRDVREEADGSASDVPEPGGGYKASATLTFVPIPGGWELHDEDGDDGTLLTSGSWPIVAEAARRYIGAEPSSDGKTATRAIFIRPCIYGAPHTPHEIFEGDDIWCPGVPGVPDNDFWSKSFDESSAEPKKFKLLEGPFELDWDEDDEPDGTLVDPTTSGVAKPTAGGAQPSSCEEAGADSPTSRVSADDGSEAGLTRPLAKASGPSDVDASPGPCIARGCTEQAERSWEMTVFLGHVGYAALCTKHADMLGSDARHFTLVADSAGASLRDPEDFRSPFAAMRDLREALAVQNQATGLVPQAWAIYKRYTSDDGTRTER